MIQIWTWICHRSKLFSQTIDPIKAAIKTEGIFEERLVYPLVATFNTLGPLAFWLPNGGSNQGNTRVFWFLLLAFTLVSKAFLKSENSFIKITFLCIFQSLDVDSTKKVLLLFLSSVSPQRFFEQSFDQTADSAAARCY